MIINFYFEILKSICTFEKLITEYFCTTLCFITKINGAVTALPLQEAISRSCLFFLFTHFIVQFFAAQMVIENDRCCIFVKN